MLSWLIENTVIALLLSGGVIVVTTLLRPRPAICHVLWLLVLVKLVTPPLFDWSALAPAARQEVQSLYAEHVDPVVSAIVGTPVSAAEPLPASVVSTAPQSPIVSVATPMPRPDPTATAPAASWTPSLTAVLLGVWGLGSTALLTLLLRRGLRVRRLLRDQRTTPVWLAREKQRLCAQLRIRPPKLVVLPGLATPCTGGLLRTRVFWPAALTDVADRDRAIPVLAHELAHVCRRDPLVARFELLAALAWFWHPLFWFVRSRVREYAEQDCDARAVALMAVPPRAYAETLLGLSAGGVLPPVALPARGRGVRVFERRLAAIMRGRRAKLPRAFAIAAAALLLPLLPSWSLSPTGTARVPGTAPPEDHHVVEAQDPQDKQKPIGRVAHRDAKLAVVRLDDGVATPTTGTTLWIGDGETVKGSLSVSELGDGLVFGRVRREREKITTGDLVWLRPKRAGPKPPSVATGAVRHVAGRVVTMEFRTRQKLKAGQSWLVYLDGEEVGKGEIQLVERQFVFFRIEPEATLPLGAEIALAPIPAPAPAAAEPKATVSGELGKPLPAGGGSAPGTTLIADYSDNRIVEVDASGKATRLVEDVYGAWDAERLPDGHLLITEFSVSRVRELDGDGKTVWKFGDLKNPYDADRLPNGNTLIADTFGSRVIEVSAKGQIVWKFDGIRAFDADRLANGNTLMADGLKDRVIEVDRDGKLVWEALDLRSPHDADRLDNGNTLVTLRTANKVVELTPGGEVVFELGDLKSPSDADRLPNGNTLAAENGMVREFDPTKKVVWRKEMSWAVEVNRY